MADQEYKVKVTTTADTTGIKQAEAELAALDAKAKSTAGAAGTVPPTAGAGPVPGTLLTPSQGPALSTLEQQLAKTNQLNAIASQTAVIEETKLQLAAAKNAEDEANVSILTQELRIRTAVLGVMRAQTLNEGELVALTENEAVLLGTIQAETAGIASAGLLAGASFGKARGEAVVLAREMATGGNTIRTMGALLGSLGVPISIAATAAFVLVSYFREQAKAIKEAALEQIKLNEQIEKELRTLSQIKDIGAYEKLREDTRGRIEELKQELAIETDSKKITAINNEIAAKERLLGRAPQIAAKALEQANHEARIKFEIEEQAKALELEFSAQERARAAAAKRVELENSITNIRLEGTVAGIEERRESGEISALDAVTEKANAKRAALEENFNRQQENDRQSIESIKQQAAAADIAAAAEEGRLKALQDRQKADVAAVGDVDKQRANFERLTQLSKQADAAALAAAEQEKSVRAEAAFSEESRTREVEDAAVNTKKTQEEADAANLRARQGATALAEAQKASGVAVEDQKKLQDELIIQQGVLKERQDELNKARKAGEGIPAAEEAVKREQDKFDAQKAAADEQLGRDTERANKRRAAILEELALEDQINAAKDSGASERAALLEIELAYRQEINRLQREGLSLEEATAEAELRRSEAIKSRAEKGFIQAGGATGAIFAERQKEQQEQQQKILASQFEAQRAELQRRAERGVAISETEAKTFGLDKSGRFVAPGTVPPPPLTPPKEFVPGEGFVRPSAPPSAPAPPPPPGKEKPQAAGQQGQGDAGIVRLLQQILQQFQ